MQVGITRSTSSDTTIKVTYSTTTNNNHSHYTWFLHFSFPSFLNKIKMILSTDPTSEQPDYSQQRIEYYRSIGQNDIADQIMQ